MKIILATICTVLVLLIFLFVHFLDTELERNMEDENKEECDESPCPSLKSLFKR